MTNNTIILAEIARLSALSPIEYDLQRKQASEQLGIRIETLDREIKRLRPNHEAANNDNTLSNDEPYPEPVDGAKLLDELAATFHRYAVMPEHADTALALWVTFTWFIDTVNVAPILAISSPEKQCGKTTVLSLVSNLSANAVPSSNITPAALFRVIEAWQPTIILDEADTFIRNSDELRGVINSGHTRTTAFVIRNVGDDHEPKRFSTWSAKAIALIGKLPETIHDRSIIVELRRKLTNEKTAKLRHSNTEEFAILRSKLKRFSDDSKAALKAIKPSLPDDISDRAADNWEPLLAIAELVGGNWKERAFEAAITLSGRINTSLSKGTELLADIERIFSEKGCDKISSYELVQTLCDDEEMPWATYNRGHQISPRQIAKILDEYKIKSKTIRLGHMNTPKGFERKQFEDAFMRYLVQPETPVNTPQTKQCGANIVAEGITVADTKNKNATHNLNINADCGIVAAERDHTDEEMLEMLGQADSAFYATKMAEPFDDTLPF